MDHDLHDPAGGHCDHTVLALVDQKSCSVHNKHIAGFFFDSQKEQIMKLLAVLLVTAILTGCGTLGGAISGAGEDLQRAGAWIKPSDKDTK